MTVASSCSTGLLELLNETDARSLRAIAQRVPLAQWAVLQEAGAPVQFTIIPESGLLLLAFVLDDGAEVVVCSIDRGGAIHTNPEADPASSCLKIIVALSGTALQIPVGVWKAWIGEHSDVRAMFSQYSGLLLAEVQQNLACIAKHDVESRLCRWLLHMYQCQERKDIPITHQALAQFMGIRRTTVTLIAKALQDARIIFCRRGVIQVIDPYALQESACECCRTATARLTAFRSQMVRDRPLEPRLATLNA